MQLLMRSVHCGALTEGRPTLSSRLKVWQLLAGLWWKGWSVDPEMVGKDRLLKALRPEAKLEKGVPMR